MQSPISADFPEKIAFNPEYQIVASQERLIPRLRLKRQMASAKLSLTAHHARVFYKNECKPRTAKLWANFNAAGQRILGSHYIRQTRNVAREHIHQNVVRFRKSFVYREWLTPYNDPCYKHRRLAKTIRGAHCAWAPIGGSFVAGWRVACALGRGASRLPHAVRANLKRKPVETVPQADN